MLQPTAYADVSIAFTVDRISDVTGDAARRFTVVERSVAPYVKNYDAVDRPWFARRDVSTWTGFAA